jgi:hypothetical protein
MAKGSAIKTNPAIRPSTNTKPSKANNARTNGFLI